MVKLSNPSPSNSWEPLSLEKVSKSGSLIFLKEEQIQERGEGDRERKKYATMYEDWPYSYWLLLSLFVCLFTLIGRVLVE